MRFILQTANVVSDAKNCLYPNKVEVGSAEELQKAVKFDHVCAEYQKNYRSIANFIKSNVIVMDCDNDHSENPDDWITPEKLDDLLTTVSYAIAFSRNHMKEKNGRTARPKFHVYFEIKETTDPQYYAAIKAAIKKAYPFFDGNALDAARFLFGADAGECIWHEEWDIIDELVEVEPLDAEEAEKQSDPILEGSRNSTMSRFAGRVLKRYGNTEKAKEAFLDHAKKCDPPLPDAELKTIWGSAVRFYTNVVMKQEGYVAPDKYNEEFGGYLRPVDQTDMDEAKALIKAGIPKEVVALGVKEIAKEPICVEGKHEAIVSEEQWQLVQEKREELSSWGEKTEDLDRISLLCGLAKCPACGGGLVHMRNKSINKNKGGYYKTLHYYSCRNYRKAEGRTCSFKHTYNQEKVDSSVYEIVSNLHTLPQFREAVDASVGDNQHHHESNKEFVQDLLPVQEEK